MPRFSEAENRVPARGSSAAVAERGYFSGHLRGGKPISARIAGGTAQRVVGQATAAPACRVTAHGSFVNGCRFGDARYALMAGRAAMRSKNAFSFGVSASAEPKSLSFVISSRYQSAKSATEIASPTRN